MTTTCDETLLDELFAEFLSALDREPDLDAAQWASRLPGSLRQQFLGELHALDRCAAVCAGTPDPGRSGYRLGACLGRGASARVHLAEQVGLGRPVAIKMLHDGGATDPQAVARLRREARILAALQHPAIVAVHDVTTIDRRPGLVQQLAPGRSLRAWIAAAADVRDEAHAVACRLLRDTRTVVTMFARLAEALAHAHARGIVHRDVKPANVVVDDDGRPMLVDFGLARVVGSTLPGGGSADEAWTGAGDVIGTPLYMAPEQLAGLAITAAADVWALGSMLQECLTGHAAAGPEAVLPREVPARLRTLILACRRARPAARPTAVAVAEQLQAMLRRRPRTPVVDMVGWRLRSVASAWKYEPTSCAPS